MKFTLQICKSGKETVFSTRLRSSAKRFARNIKEDTAHVSVVIPAHNLGIYLRPVIESVIAQTFTDWDLVVMDDGSNEDLSYVKDMGNRVRLIRQKNRGVFIARNVGIHESGVDSIAFLDALDCRACDLNNRTHRLSFFTKQAAGN